MARERYTTPTAFYGALKHKAQLLARSEGLTVADVLTSYFFSRLVARVFHAQPDAWVIKGGHALLMRYGSAARLSQDVDIQHHTPAGVVEAVADLGRAAALDLDDFLAFTPARMSLHENGANGAKQVFRVHMATHEVGVLRVDVVTGPTLHTPPDVRRVAPLIDLPWPADWPEAKVFPIEHHLADKICALFERHHGAPSSRYRDLADILLISQQEAVIDGAYAQLTLRSEARRRRLVAPEGIDFVLPDAFHSPGPAWPDRYPAAARQVPGLQGCATWVEAATAADTFLTPLLAPGPPGNWSAQGAAWQAAAEHSALRIDGRDVQRARSIADEVSAKAARAAGALPHPQDREQSDRPPMRPDVPPPPTGPGQTPGL